MCGIAGIVHAESTDGIVAETLRRMCDQIVHRGPDDYGEYVNGHVGLAMRRLSIIDVEGGRQPIANEDSTVWVVFNGEIYNYRQLRSELELTGHRFRTTSDTEVIVHLFEELGDKCVQRLRGMFAFAVWDVRGQTLTLARDRLGIKPLYVADVRGGIAFASELKALLAHRGIPRDIDPNAVAEYFTHLCVPGDLSIFRAVRKLPPAHVLTYTGGRTYLRRYWDVQPDPDHQRSAASWVDETRERLRAAVGSHLVADVPVGAFLSGGLDSAAMVGVMAEASSEPVRTFTVGFTTSAGSFDERRPARMVAERYGTIHEECLLAPALTDLVPRIVAAFDEPFADSSAIPNFLVCQETARSVKVALSGLGADELFGGYARYVGLAVGDRYRRLPRFVRAAIAALARTASNRVAVSRTTDRLRRFVAAAELSSAEQYRAFISGFSNVGDILHPDVRRSAGARPSRYADVIGRLAVDNPVDLGLFADLHLYLPDDLLTLTDRISMAHSLEVRVPFLDHELVEFAARVPAGLKVQGLGTKVLFRRAIEPWVPRAHFTRPKQGFSVPLAQWLRGPLSGMLDDLVASRVSRESAWLDGRTVRRLVDEHRSGNVCHEVRLWAIICFLEWERQTRV
jgi:asparagine synthase (glutamine-hydrolysing)